MADETERPSSPVCYADEADERYAGYLTRTETADLLRALLAFEDAMAGASGADPAAADAARRRRSTLDRHLAAMTASAAPVAQFPGRPEGIAALLRARLPAIRDDALHADLMRLLDEYERLSGNPR